ncbi:hypothetical protein UT300018_16200 [Clostridium faecium]
MNFLLTDKYTLLYVFLQIIFLFCIVKSSKKGENSKEVKNKLTIFYCIILIIFNYIYLSLNYVLK